MLINGPHIGLWGYAAEVAAVAASVQDDGSSVNEMNINEKINKLNDVRQRLGQLKTLVADYEVSRKKLIWVRRVSHLGVLGRPHSPNFAVKSAHNVDIAWKI